MTKKSNIKLRSKVVGKSPGWRERMDSVKWIDKNKRQADILYRAWRCYSSLDKWREDSSRNYRYVMGDQWGDPINGGAGCECKTERESIIERGNIPLTNNMLNRLIRALVGVWRKQDKIPSCDCNDPDERDISDMLTTALQVALKNNEKKEIDAEGFIRYLITGWAMQKYTWDYRDYRYDMWVHNIPNYEMVFWDTNMTDSRAWDISIIGEIHDLTFGEACRTFAHSREDYAKLEAIYKHASDDNYLAEYYGEMWNARPGTARSFLIPHDRNLCRVIEVWTKERRPKYICQDEAQEISERLFEIDEKDKPFYDMVNENRLNQARQWNLNNPDTPIDLNDVALIRMDWYMAEYWYVRYMSPFGDILDEHESEFEHGEHPYVLKLYPFTNGEVHSFVADLIDQQRYINRLISVNDKMILSSAKGVLLYPMSMVPQGVTVEQLQREWNQPDAVMFYDDLANTATNARPEQIANRLTNIGMTEMLQLQMQVMEEASGVNGALQGKPGFAGQSAALYAQQTQNASVSVLDLLDSYDNFLLKGAKKGLKIIQQYYDTGRMIIIGGGQGAIVYDRNLAGGVDLNVTMFNGSDSPDARKIQSEILDMLYSTQAISARQFVELRDLPYKRRLLKYLEENEQAMQQGAPTKPMDAELQQEMDADTDTVAMHNAERILRNYDVLGSDEAQQRINNYRAPQGVMSAGGDITPIEQLKR